MIKKIITAITGIALAVGLMPTTAHAESHIDFATDETIHITADDMAGIEGKIIFTKEAYTYEYYGLDYICIENNTLYTELTIKPSNDMDIVLTPTGKFHEGTEVSIYGNYFIRPSENSNPVPYRGDINIDGQINVADMVCLYRYIMGKYDFRIMSYHRADVNADTMVDAFDMAKLRSEVVNHVA